MVHESAKMGLQGSSFAYMVLKDMVLYFKGRASSIRRTEDNLQKLTNEIGTLNSRKERIDRILELSVSKEKTDEYIILVGYCKILQEKYTKFLIKYQELHVNLGSSGSSLQVLDVSFLNSVIVSLQDRKSSIWTWSFWKLAKFSKRVVELYDYVSQVNKGLDEKYMMMEKKPEVVQVEHNIYELPQLNAYVDKVLNYLQHAENKRIGIVGSIGVGKTTVMELVKSRLVASQSSDGNDNLVIWVRCQKGFETEDKMFEAIQDEIMVRLQIYKDKTKSIDQNADYISMRLREKKYILFMDQVFSSIDLDRLGIRKGHPHGKVVISTRNKIVKKQMKTDVEVEIHKLSKEDAFKLFENICGPIHDIRIKYIAEKIVQCCGGLPQVIVLVAEYLKGQKDETIWDGVKAKLQSETKTKLLGLQGVGNAYEMIYEKLEDYMKKCSLYMALFPSEYKIYKNYLVECWRAEGFFEHKKNIKCFRSARQEGMLVLNELANRYLLELCSDKHVQMPEYYRRVALEQDFPGEEDSKMWAGKHMNELPEQDSWITTRRMSLVNHSLPILSAEGTSRSTLTVLDLQEKTECGKICTLLLQSIVGLIKLEDYFFSRMKSLRLLDLHRTGIESLPSSIGDLEKLRSLYLNECSNLATLPREVKELTELELLDIRRTSINPWLPQEIESMVRLRCLRVTFDHKGCTSSWKGKEVEVTTPWDIISNLKVLEELTIETDICSEGWINIADQIVDVLVNLVQLTTLHFNFHTLESLQKFTRCSRSWKNTGTRWGNNTFKSFRFFVGCHKMLHPCGSDICGVSAERHLRLSSIDKEFSSVDLEVLKQASAFELIGNSNAKSLNEFNFANMGTLQVCAIEGCNNVECIVDVDEMNKNPMETNSSNGILQNLEKLILYNLQSLRCIWKGPFFPESLLSLTVLILSDCPELKKITTSEIWISLKKLVIVRCRKLTQLSLTRDNAKKLTYIECEASWWMPLQLEDGDKKHFNCICHFIDLEMDFAPHEGETSSSMMQGDLQEITIDEYAENSFKRADNEIIEINSFANNNEQLNKEGFVSRRKWFPWSKNKNLRNGSKIKEKDQGEPSNADSKVDNRERRSEELISIGNGSIADLEISEIKDHKSADMSKEDVIFHNGATSDIAAEADHSTEEMSCNEISEINPPTNDEIAKSLGDQLSKEGLLSANGVTACN